MQWGDDCLFDSSGLQTIALRIHLFLLFWGIRKGFFLTVRSLEVFQLGALHWAGLQATDVATTGSPASLAPPT